MIHGIPDHFWWLQVFAQVEQHPPRTPVRIEKAGLPHPRDAGARVSVGIPRGQIADFRFPPDHRCRGLHVQDFGDHWQVHVDEVHPACDVLDHLRVDAPGGWVSGGAVVGGIVGLLLGRSKGAMLAGAGIGALLAASTAGGKDDEQGSLRVEPR